MAAWSTSSPSSRLHPTERVRGRISGRHSPAMSGGARAADGWPAPRSMHACASLPARRPWTRWYAATSAASPAPPWSATRRPLASCARSTRRATRTSSAWPACMACSIPPPTAPSAPAPTSCGLSRRPLPRRWRNWLLRHVEVARHETEIDERLGIGVARDLPGRLPEGDLLIDVADIEPALGIDVRQAGGDQRRRLLQRVAQNADHLVVVGARHQLAVLALAEGLVIGGRAAAIADQELLDHRPAFGDGLGRGEHRAELPRHLVADIG